LKSYVENKNIQHVNIVKIIPTICCEANSDRPWKTKAFEFEVLKFFRWFEFLKCFVDFITGKKTSQCTALAGFEQIKYPADCMLICENSTLLNEWGLRVESSSRFKSDWRKCNKTLDSLRRCHSEILWFPKKLSFRCIKISTERA